MGTMGRLFYPLCLLIGLTAVAISDIRLDDEAVYLMRGLELLSSGSKIKASFGPLYSFYLGIVHSIFRDALVGYYANIFILSSLFPAIISIGLRVAGFNRDAAQLTALIFGMSSVNLFGFPKVGIFTSVILIAGFALRGIWVNRRDDYEFLLLGVTLLLASYTRADMTVALFLYVGFRVSKDVIRNRRKGLRIRKVVVKPGTVVMVAMIVIVYTLFGFPLEGGRSYDAFSDHYQVAVIGTTTGDNPFRSGKLLTSVVFNGSTSVIEAAINNPSDFARHCIRNIGNIPGTVLNMTSFAGLSYSGLIPLTVCIVCLLKDKLSIRQTWRGSLQKSNGSNPIAFWGAVVAVTLLSSCIIYPRDHYFVLIVFPVAAFYCLGLSGFKGKALITLGRFVEIMSFAVLCTALYAQLMFSVLPLRNRLLVDRLKPLAPGTIASASYGISTFLGINWDDTEHSACTEPGRGNGETPKGSNKEVDYVVVDRFMRGSSLLRQLECRYVNIGSLEITEVPANDAGESIEVYGYDKHTKKWKQVISIGKSELKSQVKEILKMLTRKDRL